MNEKIQEELSSIQSDQDKFYLESHYNAMGKMELVFCDVSLGKLTKEQAYDLINNIATDGAIERLEYVLDRRRKLKTV